MIAERTLKRWRRESLINLSMVHAIPPEGINISMLMYSEFNERILRLTQEVMDQHLLRVVK